jgi:IS5 family transposase
MSYSQHVLMENRNGLVVDVRIDEAMGKAEVTNALQMLSELPDRVGRRTIAGDKGYDTKEFVQWTRAMNVTPHVAKNEYPGRSSALDDRTTRHVGYEVSQRIRKRVEEIFGWTKTVGNFRRTRYKGQARTSMASFFVGAAYNLLRMGRLMARPA